MFCNVCLDALQHRKGWYHEKNAADPYVILLAHHQSAKSLESSARDACELCYPFWCQVDDTSRSSMRMLDDQWTTRNSKALKPCTPPHHEIQDSTGFVTICVVANLGHDGSLETIGAELMISISFDSDYRDEISTLQNITGIYTVCRGSERKPGRKTSFSSNSTASAESWKQATSWIQKCTASHRACNIETNAGSWHPTRLLDLTDPAASSDTFRIVLTPGSSVKPDETYTTLSHCWGSAQFLQLNKLTYDELKKGVSLQRLPKTFQEAIQVTRQVGVRYLWIDSLCILQDRDDLSDWLVEAAQMHKVYLHSFCNISAAGAENSSIGLFFERDPRLSHSSDLRLCVEGLGLTSGADYVDCNIVDFLFWSNSVGTCTLNTRGWVLQERLLSPRVLHFAKDQLFWECREHSAAEFYPDSLPLSIRNGLPANFKRLNPASHSMDLKMFDTTSDDSIFYHEVWNSIIQAYSSTRLTKSSDKLIALSGVAKYFGTQIQDTYVVGMWNKYLASSLLWRVDNQSQVDGSPSTRPETYRAPTFSWMAVDGMISTGTPATHKDMLIQVIGFNLDYVTDDTTGLVTGGYIDLKGQVRPFRMVVKYITPRYQQLFMEVGGNIVKSSTKKPWEHGPLVCLDVGQTSFDEENLGRMLYYMPTKKQRVDISIDYHRSYLLLVALDTCKSTFRRIGLAFTGEKVEIDMLQGSPAANLQFQELAHEITMERGVRIIRIL